LHSDVIQRASRLGVDLQDLAAHAGDAKLAAALASKVDDVDAVPRALRAAIVAPPDE
jgi:hypothetical protein